MRVLHVTATYYPASSYGGPVESLRQLCAALVRGGVDVEVATTNADGRKQMAVDRHTTLDGTTVHYHPATRGNQYGFSPRLFTDLPSAVRRADVVHCHGTALPSSTAAAWLACLLRKPLVVSPHGSYMAWARKKKAWRKRLYGALLDRPVFGRALFHATSEAERDELRELGYRDAVVVANGIEPREVQAPAAFDWRAALRLPPDTKIVATVCRFDPVKNLELLLDATRDLGVHVIVAGDHANAYGQHIGRLLESAGRGDVHLVGFVRGEQKRALLQQADVYAASSHMESYGMAIAEALAAGCPVVASTGTPWSSVESGSAGYWVHPVEQEFRVAIRALLKSDREALRNRATAVAQAHSWDSRVTEYLALYQRAVSKPTPAAVHGSSTDPSP